MKSPVLPLEKVEIRPFKKVDSGSVCALNRLLGPGSMAGPAFFASQCLGPKALAKCWVAEISGKIVGFSISHDWVSFGGGSKVRQIDLLFVAEKFRRFGIATSLIENISKDARKSKCARVDYEVDPKNKPARELYESLGYEQSSAKRLRYQKYLK